MGFLFLKSLFDAFFLVTTDNRGEIELLTFFMQIYMGYLNNSLMKDKITDMKTVLGIEPILRAGSEVEALKIDAKEPLLSVKASKDVFVTSLFLILTNKEFDCKLQLKQNLGAILAC